MFFIIARSRDHLTTDQEKVVADCPDHQRVRFFIFLNKSPYGYFKIVFRIFLGCTEMKI